MSSSPFEIQELHQVILNKVGITDILAFSLTCRLAAQICKEKSFWETRFTPWRIASTVSGWIAEYITLNTYNDYLTKIDQGIILLAEVGPGLMNAYWNSYGNTQISLTDTLFHYLQSQEKQRNIYIIKYSIDYGVHILEFYSNMEEIRSIGYVSSVSIFHIRAILIGLIVFKAKIGEFSFPPDMGVLNSMDILRRYRQINLPNP